MRRNPCSSAAAKAALTGFAVVLATLVMPASAQKGADYRSVAEVAVMYDAPAVRGRKLFVAPRGMPVEVVVAIEGWVKVRDRAGDMAWVERRAVSERRTVVSVAPGAMRERADDGANVALEVAADVVLELIEVPAPGAPWVRVKHRDGATGFMRTSQVWGL
jgi:SH3-like domain-containing protein